jgi:hypothetical protein
MIFLPIDLESELSSATNSMRTPFLRPQWMADGRRALIATTFANDLALAVVPCAAGGGSSKLFSGFSAGQGGNDVMFLFPIPVDRERAFLQGTTNSILRLDLNTGTVVRHQRPGEEGKLTLLPGVEGRGVFYVEEGEVQTFGRIDPETFREAPLITFTNKCAEGLFFAYDSQGKRLALVEQGDPSPRLLIFEKRKVVFSRSLGLDAERLSFGNAQFSRKGDLLLASYQLQDEGQTNSTFGLMEIPLSNAPIRQIPLLEKVNLSGKDGAIYFQIAVSHDGSTAAGSSAYLACQSETFRPEDCALFLIDLRSSNRKITKVPIPLPPKITVQSPSHG